MMINIKKLVGSPQGLLTSHSAFTRALLPLTLLSALVVLAACDDDEPSPPVVTAGMMMTDAGVETPDCSASCQDLLSCAGIAQCEARVLDATLNECLMGCEDEATAAEIISDAQLVCSSSEGRTRVRFASLAECAPPTPDRCANQVCGAGFSCAPESGRCVPNSCEGVSCEVGSMCVNGECVDACTGVTCPEGLGCLQGECLDLCFGMNCGEGQECEPANGSCVNLCEGVRCGRGERCDSGECVPACSDVVCEEDEICDEETGSCVDLCEGVTCEEGFACNPLSGVCRDLCDSTSCVDGWVCDRGSCVFDDPCAEVSCPMNSLCDPDSRRCETYFCEADRFEENGNNNEASGATELAAQTQRLDDLSICSFDLDWYLFTLPANTSARISARFAHVNGDLILRLYNELNLLSPQIEVNTETDDEYLAIPADTDERRFYIRVSSGGAMFDQNRYSLVIELNLPGELCNQDDDCGSVACLNSLCGGEGGADPEPGDPTDPTDPTDPIDPVDPACAGEMYEPNNEIATATDISTLGMGPWSAALCEDDVDYYSFTITETSDVEISVAFTHDLGDLDLSVLNGESFVIENSTSSDDDEQIALERLEPGEYWIEVRSYGEFTGNTYTLSYSSVASLPEGTCNNDVNCAGDYVCINTTCAPPEGYCDDAASPNASYEAPYALSLPSSLELTLCEPDFFSLELVADQSVSISVSFVNQTGEDIDLRLYSPSGVVVRTSTGVNELEQIAYVAETSGTYTLEVYPYVNEFNPQAFIARYTLSVE